MFFLLWRLLLHPKETLESVLKSPNNQQSSQLSFFIVTLLMINAVFMVANVSTPLGYGKWVLAFLLPPMQFWLHRTFLLLSARLGMMLFAGKFLPRDPMEMRVKHALVRFAYPYVVFPLVCLLIFAALFDNMAVQELLILVGVMFMFILLTYALKIIYGAPATAAFWGPFLVFFLINFILAGMIVMLLIALSMIPGLHFAP